MHVELCLYVEMLQLLILYCRNIQVRVVQNKEPNHFFRLFHGGMIVQFGGHNNEPEGREGPTGVALYQVKATNAEDVHAVQVFTFPMHSHCFASLLDLSALVLQQLSLRTAVRAVLLEF